MILEIGSVWRERDGQFTRYVVVERMNCGNIMDPRAQIRTCDEFGRPLAGSRSTLAKQSAFGRRYDFIRTTKTDGESA